ncbi:MAG: hypothetical protein AAFQ67_05155 [Pseudomonadota bacterium]
MVSFGDIVGGVTGVVGAVGSIVGADKAGDAARDASQAQVDAFNRALDQQDIQYRDAKARYEPFYQIGLEGLYGPNGLQALLGYNPSPPANTSPYYSQTGGGGVVAPPGYNGTVVSDGAGGYRPSYNAFAQPIAIAGPEAGTNTGVAPGLGQAATAYGATPGTNAPAATPAWEAYLDDNPDVASAYDTAASSPHFRKGAGREWDTDGDGQLSRQEWAQAHYDTYGENEGRNWADVPAALPPPPPPPPVQAPPPPPNAFAQPVAQPQPAAQPVQSPPPPPPPSGDIGSQTAALRQTPGHQFMMDESRRQLENSFASRGKLLSGGALTALSDRAQGLADTTYQQSVNNQFNLANLGLGAAVNTGNAGSNYANAASGLFGGIGNAQAGGYIGGSNAFNAGLQGATDSIFRGLGSIGGGQGWF